VKFVYEPLREADGTTSGVMALAHEITEQVVFKKKIQESEAHFRKMTDLMPAKISNANPDGDVIYFNNNWLDFAGMNFEDLKAFGYHQIMHPDEIPEFQQRLQQAFETGEELEMEMRFKNAAGNFIWHLNVASPVKDSEGKIKMWVGVTTEIQKIKEEEERKGDFIKMVSHELKTPVTSIKGYVQILLMMLNDEPAMVTPEQIKSSLVRIDKQIVNLTRLIYEMLDLTRIEAGSLQLKMEAFSLNNLIKDIADDIGASQPKYNIELQHDVRVAVFADRDRIGQVVINFINNAIKYSPQSSSIEITIYQPEPGKVSVSVKDFGIGINKEEQQKIFERFYRVGGKSEKTFPGFGIGLFIASSIIQKHNGSISINSEKGKGSEFIFTLNTVPENNL
jgi:PAS domain S-box-containing protein